ncbi:MAG: hypothetical protein A2284_10340 [Deltaproteobacteria bacterium RIFOXYA12_FULL_61_11]|nr:MAG: hypothetical protein A2284_10340 [Deltaproteobacteria bacterium RIFOXYA12_FULL_61_11]
MYPLLQWGMVELSTNYLLIYLGIVLAITLFLWRAKRTGVNMVRATDITIFMIITLIVGARLFYVFLAPDSARYLRSPLEILKIWKGGFSSAGGAGLFLLTTLWYCKHHGVNWRRVFDLLATSGFLGLGFSRIGCFFAGCCYGVRHESWFAVVFERHGSSKPLTGIPLGIPLWPTQLVLAFNAFLLVALTWWYFPRRRFDGEVFLLGTALYTVLRFLVETYRTLPTHYQVLGFSFTDFQVMALLYLPLSLVLWGLSRTGRIPAARLDGPEANVFLLQNKGKNREAPVTMSKKHKNTKQ